MVLASVKEKMKVFSMVQVYVKYKILAQYMIYSSQNLENQKKKKSGESTDALCNHISMSGLAEYII